ncbi:EGF-like domain-containing protein [Dictyostelium discoideum AX4]|uniref:EGF-like domain-containing protein n=1 Tax=Dictyostelium discoideum TaxID=44689 RepID=Q54P15_DICDI|nr:EGF-like domain-containing protein [Dictyostelium discoideum AX4]EAL64986.2 EGF-like domain-containing protein [Dictyostelium discoideum AX4]|eukprot:XP_639902.2 EGF-like domain-containing protein [Dictyostelium discoideum AX4]
MKRDNNKYIIYLLFFQFILINLLNGQSIEVKDVSDPSFLTYNKYPIDSNKNTCNFDFFIRSVISNGTGGLFTISSDSSLSITSLKVFNDQITQIDKILVSDVPNGQNSISLTSNLGLINASTIINFNCELYDMNSIKIKYIPNILADLDPTAYSGYVILSGLKYKSNNLIISTNGYSVLVNSDSNKATYIILRPLNITIFNQDVTCSIYFIDYQFNFTVPSSYLYYSSNSDNQVMYYPDSPMFQKFSYFASNVISITANYTGINPLIFLYRASGGILTLPFYQNDNGTVYFGALQNFGTNERIAVVSQYGSSLVEINSTILSSIPISSETYFPSGTIYILKTTLGTFNNMTYFTVYFNSSIYFDIIDYSFSIDNIQSVLPWPFGFESGTNYKYSFKVAFLLSLMSSSWNTFVITPYNGMTSLNPLNLPPDLVSLNDATPTMKHYEMIILDSNCYLIRIAPSDDFVNGIITINNKPYGYGSLVEGDGINGPSMYEFVYENTNSGVGTIEIRGSSGKSSPYYTSQPSYYSSIPPKFVYDATAFNIYNIYLIQNVSFLYNNLNTTNKSIDNIMYFNFTDVTETNVELEVVFLNNFKLLNGRISKQCFAKWNSTIKLFQVEFRVPANVKTGYFNYNIKLGSIYTNFYSQLLPASNQLYVTSSRFDQYGPIFKTIDKSISQNPNQIKWSVTIQDEINGFDYGHVIVRGDMDGSRYTINLSNNTIISGNEFLGQHDIIVTIPDICATQSYSIIEIELFDKQGYSCEFYMTKSFDAPSNPFINYFGDPTINKITIYCDDYQDQTPPVLLSFQSSRVVSSQDNSQTLLFEFQVTDPESGLKSDQLPIVYATSKQLEGIFNTSEIKTIVNNNTIDYKCQIDLPYGFGYQSDILFSVYGLINNGGYFGGYSSERLMSISPNSYYMSNIPLIKKLLISKVSIITSSGGKLLIIGKHFQTDYKVHIKYLDGNLVFPQVSTPTISYSTSIIINDIKPTTNPFIIKVVSLNNLNQSNEFTVYPVVYNFIDPSPKPPIKPRIPCAGTPECGGSKNGYCKENYGCICYSPWVGIDCTSQVIIVPQPSTNTSNPSTEIPVIGGGGGNNNNETNTETILFKSLISLVSLRELDFQSNIVNTYTFEKWVYNQIDSNTNQYVTNITIPKSNTTTTITATLQWFKEKSIIKFANQQLVMNPSSIKYTIDISNYDFSSKLNQLQLIMSASISASKSDDICSSKEFGVTSDSDDDISNYIKLQVDTVSLYGRFIKRAIVDSTVQTISNILLDSSMNLITNAASSQTYIGIQLPYYSDSIIIDPDFSILIDSKSASNNNNSICSNINSKSGLSTVQLVGIIIGSVGFAAVIIISIAFCIHKNRTDAKFRLFVRNKTIHMDKKK